LVDNLYDLAQADQKLALGMNVSVCWIEGGFYCRGTGGITNLEKFSVTVHLQQKMGQKLSPIAKKMLQLPRFFDQTRWSRHNCVWPAESPRLAIAV